MRNCSLAVQFLVLGIFCVGGIHCDVLNDSGDGGRGTGGRTSGLGTGGSGGSLPVGSGMETILFKMESVQGVKYDPPEFTTFTLAQKSYITRVWTYHYNAKIGFTSPALALANIDTGEVFGPWPQVGYKSCPTEAGVPAGDPRNIPGPPDNYWVAYPGVSIPAGEYVVVDSAPESWAYTADLGNRGVAWVYGWATSGTAPNLDGGSDGQAGRSDGGVTDASRDVRASAADGGDVPLLAMDGGKVADVPAANLDGSKGIDVGLSDGGATIGSVADYLQPGAVIAEGRIGPAGGTIEATGVIRVEIPAGTFTNTETVTIRRGQGAFPLGDYLYFIDRDGGHARMSPPARVTYVLPSGAQTKDYAVIQEITSTIWTFVPSQSGATAGSLVAELSHFSGSGVSRTEKILGGTAVGSGLYVAGNLLVLGVSAGTAAMTLPPLLMAATTGAIVGELHGDSIWNMLNTLRGLWDTSGLNRALRVGGIRLYWTEEGTNAVTDRRPRVVVRCRASDGVLQEVFPGSIADAVKGIDGAVIRGGSAVTADSFFFEVPQGVLDVSAFLNLARYYYAEAGYPLFSYANSDQDKDSQVLDSAIMKLDSGDDGLWFYPYLRIDPKNVGDLNTFNELQATSAHEYWHAIVQTRKLDADDYRWLNEASATAFETEIFTSLDEHMWNYGWGQVASVLRSGLIVPGNEQLDDPDPVKRGYSLWPWSRFLIHKHSHASLLQMAQGNMAKARLVTLFRDFCYSMLLTDPEYMVPDQVEQLPALGMPALWTGWQGPPGAGKPPRYLDLSELQAQRTFLQPGKLTLTGAMSAPRPLAFALLPVKVPAAPPADSTTNLLAPPPVIVRRDKPASDEEIVALRPTVDPSGFGLRRPLANMVTGKGAVVVPAEWTASTDSKAAFYMPVALIGTSAEPPSWLAGTPEPNPLMIYSLRPPTPTSFAPLATDTLYMDVAFKKPDLGSPDVSSLDCLGSYRIFVKGADGKQQMLDTRLTVTNSPNDHGPVLASAIPAGTVAVGLASEDKVMLDPASGRPLLSEVAWLTLPISVTIDPPSLEAQLGSTQTFKAIVNPPAANGTYEWFYDGTSKQKGPSASYAQLFAEQGTHTVSVKLLDGSDKVLSSASSPVNVAATSYDPLLITSCGDGDYIGASACSESGAFGCQLHAKGGKEPYDFSIISGSLPPGVSVDRSGLIAGTATGKATGTVTMQVKDSRNVAATHEFRWSYQFCPMPADGDCRHASDPACCSCLCPGNGPPVCE